MKVITFFTFPLIAAALSPKSFGILELVTTLIGLSSLFVNFGLNNAVQRFYWDSEISENNRQKLVSTALFLQLIFWSCLALVLVLLTPLISTSFNLESYKLTNPAIFAAILLIYVTQSTQYIQDVIRLHFSPMRFFIFIFLGRALTAITALIVVVYFAKGIEGFLLTTALVGLAILPLGLFMIRRDLCLSFDKEYARKILSYGYPFIFVGMAYWLFGSMDRWMISIMASTEETGQYSIAFRFSSIVFFVSVAFSQAWSPYAIKIKTDFPNRYKEIFSNVLILLIFTMMIVGGGVALFSGEIIGIMMPEEYHSAAIPLSILCFTIILQSTQQVTVLGIALEKKTIILAKISWIAALINFIGNFILISYYGITGATIATLISHLFITVSYSFYSQKIHPLPIPWNKILFLFVVSCCILLVAILFNNTDFIWSNILLKLGFALSCLIIGLIVIPIKDILNDAVS